MRSPVRVAADSWRAWVSVRWTFDGAASATGRDAVTAERPCVDCGDPTLNAERCRDCDLEYITESSRCKDCGWWMTNGLLWAQRTHDTMENCPWMAT